MCIAIYLILIGLFLFYTNDVIDQYRLAIAIGEEGTMVVAAGWEMALPLWPLLVTAMLLSSAVSVWVTRRCQTCTGGDSETRR